MTMVEPNIAGGIIGGLFIGTASVLMLAGGGRLAGISGILGGLFGKWEKSEGAWRLLFLAGLVCGAAVISFTQEGLSVRLQANTSSMVFAGILVGFGTRMGGGCTSGHGVCGLARRSRRSVFATLTFILTAMVTVFITRHIL